MQWECIVSTIKMGTEIEEGGNTESDKLNSYKYYGHCLTCVFIVCIYSTTSGEYFINVCIKFVNTFCQSNAPSHHKGKYSVTNVHMTFSFRNIKVYMCILLE